jgi:hypothetical protein
MNDLIILAFIILLPIIPAYLLFKVLPSRATVSGPLKGLKINLGGAFAGYFAVVLVILSSYNIWHSAPAVKWTVQGRIIDKETGLAVQPLDPRSVTLSPPSPVFGNDGNFTLYFTPTLNDDGRTYDFPKLVVGCPPEYSERTIDMDPAQLASLAADLHVKSEQGHHIKVGDIPLSKVPAWHPTDKAETLKALPAD